MVTLKKAVAAGVTVSAAGLTALSTAWACTSIPGEIKIDPAAALPGETVQVEGRVFVSGTDPVQIRWDSISGLLLGTALGEDTAAANKSFSVTITVPNDRVGNHFLVATQRASSGGVIGQAVARFSVLGPASTDAPTTPVPSTEEPTPTPSSSPGTGTPAPATAATPPAAAEATPARPPASSGLPAPSATPAPAGTSGRTAAVSPSLAGAVPAPAPAAAAAPLLGGAAAEGSTPQAPVLLPAKDLPPNARDVWSGLDESSTFAPGASLTAEPPAQPGRSPALALVLMALGAVGLGAGARPLLQRKRRPTTSSWG